jgi:hypothetical protein
MLSPLSEEGDKRASSLSIILFVDKMETREEKIQALLASITTKKGSTK